MTMPRWRTETSAFLIFNVVMVGLFGLVLWSVFGPSSGQGPEGRPRHAERSHAHRPSGQGPAPARDHRLGPLYATAVALGLRKGELLALRWADVDRDAGTITITNTLHSTGLAPTKTERSRRTVVMPRMVIAALRRHWRRQAAERLAAGRRWQHGDYVFATKVGTPL